MGDPIRHIDRELEPKAEMLKIRHDLSRSISVFQAILPELSQLKPSSQEIYQLSLQNLRQLIKKLDQMTLGLPIDNRGKSSSL